MKYTVNCNIQKDYLEMLDNKQPIINHFIRDMDIKLSDKLCLFVLRQSCRAGQA